MAARPALLLGCLVVGCYLVAAVRGGTLACRQEGRFPHPEDCGSYVDCLRTADGGLRAREGSCHGFAFSGEKRRCVELAEKPDCVPKGVRISFPLSDFDYLCTDDEQASDCVNCNLAFSCVKGTAVVDICDTKSLCEVSDAFGGSTCLLIPSQTAECTCDKTGLSQDPYNATYFNYCDKTTNPFTLETFMCEEGTTFSDVTKKCEVSGPPETPACEGKSGSFVNPSDCRWYYTCIPGGIVRTGACPEGEYFDEASGHCEGRCTLAPPNPLPEMCEGVGHYPHPSKDCTKYLVCKVTDGKPEEATCFPGLYYNEAARKCIDTTPSVTCKTGFNYYSCPDHEDLTCPEETPGAGDGTD